MKLKRVILSLVAVALAVGIGGSMVSAAADTTNATSDTSSSATSGSTVQTKALSKAYVVYGAGLASEDKHTVALALGVNQLQRIDSNWSDYAQYLNSATIDASMISSVALAPADPGTGEGQHCRIQW